MCILLKLHYAKFDASKLFCSEGIKEKPLEVGSTPLLPVKGRVKKFCKICFAHIFAKFEYFVKVIIYSKSPDHVF